MYASLGEVAETSIRCCWNQAILGIVPRADQLDQRFLKYVLWSLRPGLPKRARSSTQMNLNAEEVGNLPIPCPPLPDQRRIAEFLDGETTRIERLIELKRSLLLKLPLRTGAVAHATLAGLPRNARLAFAVTWLSGGTPPRDDPASWSGDLPWVSSKDLGTDHIRDTLEHIDQDAAKVHSTVAPARSVLIATRGMALARRLPLAIIDRPMAFNQDLKGLVPLAPLDDEYLRIVLRAFEAEILCFVLEAAHGTRRLETKDLKAFRFPLPSSAEQRRKVDEVREVEDGNAALAERVTRHVALLRERRDALVTAAVTGQLDTSSYRDSARGAS